MEYPTFNKQPNDSASPLTRREQTILHLLAQDMTSGEVAERLVIAPSTVKWYVKEIYSKLGIHSRSELARYADQIAADVKDEAPVAVPNNLPARAANYIGRQREIEAVCAYLTDGETRLVTLIGAAGIGKSRMSLECAGALLNHFPDGVFTIELAPLDDDQQPLEILLQALGLQQARTDDLLELLKRYLHDKHLLLVMDNFEHLLSASKHVSALLAAAARLRVLATSREPLRLYGEQEFHVPPLSLPDPNAGADLAAFQSSEAVTLFVKRAAFVKPDFALTPDNAAAVADICRQLDGLPLAIELAAARIRLFSPDALLDRLNNQLATLTTGARDLPQRHQSLRAAIDWSYKLLDEGEQRLLARLAVFVGGWSLDAVEPVCGVDLPADPIDLLESLLNKSLVQQVAGEDGEPRFLLLEMIYEYAAEKLMESGETAAQQQRHFEYTLTLAEAALTDLWGPNHYSWEQILKSEFANCRKAIRWSSEQDLDGCGRLYFALFDYWAGMVSLVERRQLLQPLLDKAHKLSPSVTVRVLRTAGQISQSEGDLTAARGYLETASALARELDDPLLAECLRFCAWVSRLQIDLPAARQYIDETVGLFADAGDRLGMARALNISAIVAIEEFDFPRVQSEYEQSLALKRDLGSDVLTAGALLNLGVFAWVQGDLIKAEQYYREALEIRKSAKIREFQHSLILNNLGVVSINKQDWQAAARLLEEAVQIVRSLMINRQMAGVLTRYALCQTHLGQTQYSLELQWEAVRSIQEVNNLSDFIYLLLDFAHISVVRERWSEAATLYGAALAMAEKLDMMTVVFRPIFVKQKIEGDLAALRDTMGEADFAQTWEIGSAMSRDDVVAFWCEGNDPVSGS